MKVWLENQHGRLIWINQEYFRRPSGVEIIYDRISAQIFDRQIKFIEEQVNASG